MTQKFKPKTDKLTVIIWTICLPVILGLSTVAFFEPATLWVLVPTDLLILYFLISPLFGYVELREDVVFIKFGFFLKREISYSKIRGTAKERKWYSDSMMSLKNSLEHVNIKYNTYDFVTVSVTDNDELVRQIEAITKEKR